jgi:hypothetical protein
VRRCAASRRNAFPTNRVRLSVLMSQIGFHLPKRALVAHR